MVICLVISNKKTQAFKGCMIYFNLCILSLLFGYILFFFHSCLRGGHGSLVISPFMLGRQNHRILRSFIYTEMEEEGEGGNTVSKV